VADPSCKVGDSFFSSGCVYLFDGSDGSLIQEFTGEPAAGQLFGFSLASLDADGDGIPDLAVGASGSGMTWIYSGLDGELITKVEGPSGSLYGSSLANAGDRDGDGKDDLWVGAPLSNGGKGSLYLQSSIDGSPLSEIINDVPWSGFASRVSVLDDIDGDGIGDLAIASPDYREPRDPDAEPTFKPTVGRVQIFRSSDQQAVASLEGSLHYELLGYSLATVPDADGDGLSDLLIGSYHGGVCLLASGTDLTLITDLSLPGVAPFQPTAAGGGFDADGDGVSDWLLGSAGMTSEETNVYGGVRIFSGHDGSVLFELDSPVSRSGLGATLSVLEGFGVAMGETMLADTTTGGRGHVQVWEFEQFDASEPDSDGDGVPDSEDLFPHSNSDPTIVFYGIDSGVENRVDENGVTLADLLVGMDEPKNPRQALRGVLRGASRIQQLNRRGLISDEEAKLLFWSSVRGVIGKSRGR
jgi:hypothetical protein